MIIPGIKLGPTNWIERLDQSQTQFAEIWYRTDQPDRYIPLFQELQKRGVAFGLHFWGVTSSGHEANLAYPGSDRNESIDLIQTCLETAHRWHAQYVNIHSGNRILINLNLTDAIFSRDTNYSVIDDDLSVKLRQEALTTMGTFSHRLDIDLLVEPIPARNFKVDRQIISEQYPTSLNGLLDLCQPGLIDFTNDFCHLMAMEYGLPRHKLWQLFLGRTKMFLPYTKLVHINTLYPPYNGTDAHGGILPADFKRPGVFPTELEYIQLIKLLKMNHRVWMIGEPTDVHVANYQTLTCLLNTV